MAVVIKARGRGGTSSPGREDMARHVGLLRVWVCWLLALVGQLYKGEDRHSCVWGRAFKNRVLHSSGCLSPNLRRVKDKSHPHVLCSRKEKDTPCTFQACPFNRHDPLMGLKKTDKQTNERLDSARCTKNVNRQILLTEFI